MGRPALRRFAGPLAAFTALALSSCRSQATPPSLLDREMDAYRADHEERRLEDAKDRYAKARAEADRLEEQERRLAMENDVKRARLADPSYVPPSPSPHPAPNPPSAGGQAPVPAPIPPPPALPPSPPPPDNPAPGAPK